MTFRARPNGRGRGREAGTGVSILPYQAGINRFKAGPRGGKKVVLYGDSTIEMAIDMWNYIANYEQKTGDAFYGVNMVNGGTSGVTVDTLFNSVGQITKDFAWLKAQNPDLIVLHCGLNDVRVNTYSRAQLSANLAAGVAKIRAQIPAADVVLWTQNSMLTTDPGGNNYVVPLASAQQYTTRIYDAYNDQVGTVPNGMISVDGMTTPFSQTCPATSIYMADTLHPNQAGQEAQWRILQPLIKPTLNANEIFNQTTSNAAWLANPSSPWLVYPLAPKDTTKTTLRLATRYQTSAPYDGTFSFLDVFPPYGVATIDIANIASGDILYTPNGSFRMDGSNGIFQINPSYVRITGIPTTFMTQLTATPIGDVLFYR